MRVWRGELATLGGASVVLCQASIMMCMATRRKRVAYREVGGFLGRRARRTIGSQHWRKVSLDAVPLASHRAASDGRFAIQGWGREDWAADAMRSRREGDFSSLTHFRRER